MNRMQANNSLSVVRDRGDDGNEEKKENLTIKA